MAPERTTYLSAIGGGLGDIIVALPVFTALIKQEKVIAVMRTQRQQGFEELIPGLAGSIKESDLAKRSLRHDERYINLRGHRLQTDYFWGGPEFERDYPAFQINDILAEMCKDFDIAADFSRLEPFKFSRRPELENAVICIPGTTVDTKTWSNKNWLSLANQLECQGMSVYMLGQPEYSQSVMDLQPYIQLLETPTIKEAVDILSSAKAVVSVDTGLMHLAVQQGVPTVCLFQDPIFYRPYANAFKLLSKHCADACVQYRMNAMPQATTEYHEWTWATGDFYACQVSEEERCINSISVAQVLNTLSEAIKSRANSGI